MSSSVTDNGPTAALSDKVMMACDEQIYGDLITEIDLPEDNDSSVMIVTNDNKKVNLGRDSSVNQQNNEPTVVMTADLPSATSSSVLTQDDAVSEFFAVDSKTDSVFDNDMLISELDSEGIDFKNETDVVECHHDYDSKKLLFEDEDLVVAEVAEVADAPDAEEPVPKLQLETAAEDDDVNEPCFEIAVDDQSLNRMHVMEDVEEGCDVSGALPSSPGHAEQRPDPPKSQSELTTPVDSEPAAVNGLPPLVNTEQDAPENSPPEIKEETTKENTSEEEIEKPQSNTDKVKEESDDQEAVTKSTTNLEDQAIQEGSIQDDNDSNLSNDSSENSSQKRKCNDDEESPAKRLRTQIQQQYVGHDKVLAEYIESAGCNSTDDLQAHSEQLLAEIRTLNELAREKEREWNNILHLKKVKEELLLRMQRRRQVLLLNEKGDCPEWDLAGEMQLADMLEKNKDGLLRQNVSSGGLMMVPIVSSSPANSRPSINTGKVSRPRIILPKPIIDYNGQNSNECRQGRQGPILDVRSIIADYRQRHPETVPRRGRRLKSVLNSSNHGDTVVTTSNKSGSGGVMSMASLALGSGSQVRHGDVSSELGLLLSTMDAARQDGSRPSSADSSSANTNPGNDAGVSFKDVLVQFARLSQSERQELQAQAVAAANLAATSAGKQQPPPYPEVTLHPVPTTVATATATVTQQTNNSLLHGILTKSQTKNDSNKPTTFSPTLARLLTAPERVSNNNAQAMYTAALNSGVSISDLLTTTTTNNKSRNEITITPVGQFGQNMKHKDADHVGGDEDEAEDSADRLVIDEGGQEGSEGRNRTDNSSEVGDEVPQCQGCHQKSAQFVCAGCGNQWYCSRDCQVAAWDEHSEVCSG